MLQSGFARAPDEQLLALTSEDPEAFGPFYDRFEPDVLAFVYWATRRADIAADLTAETMHPVATALYNPFCSSLAVTIGGRAAPSLQIGLPDGNIFGDLRQIKELASFGAVPR